MDLYNILLVIAAILLIGFGFMLRMPSLASLAMVSAAVVLYRNTECR